ncbi:hypothetical protein DSECCO2_359970 [anaerobic digester metagenome]
MDKTTTTNIDVRGDQLLEDFITYRDIAPRTIDLYVYHLNIYCNYIGLNLEEMIAEAEDEEEDGIRMRRRKITKYLNDYAQYLKDSGFAPTSTPTMITAVKSFYRYYDIQLPINKRRTSRNARLEKANTQTTESIPTMEEIQRFVECCNDLYKVVALFGVSSGMGQAEIGSLTYKHVFEACGLDPYPETMEETIKKIKDKGHFIATWNIKRVKTGMKYFTFTSPELIKHLIIYLQEYHRKYPEFNPKPEDKLVRSLRLGNPVITRGLSQYFSSINKKHEFRQFNNRFVCTCHGFRRFFASTLERNKLPHLVIRRLMGHKFDNVTNAYFKIDIETAKEDYLEAVNALSTDKVEVMQVNVYEDAREHIREILQEEKLKLKDRIEIPKE